MATLVSCFGLPVPAALILLAAGAILEDANAGIGVFFVAGYAGAVLAGTVLFLLGRRFGTPAVAMMERQPGWGRIVARAHKAIGERGGVAVFIGSWLVAQIGPAVNLVSGAAGLGLTRFNAYHLTGRGIWVGGYLALGYAFSDRIVEVAHALGQVAWLVIVVVAAVGAVWGLRYLRRP